MKYKLRLLVRELVPEARGSQGAESRNLPAVFYLISVLTA